jgi:ketosteroid isomerase-like protein
MKEIFLRLIPLPLCLLLLVGCSVQDHNSETKKETLTKMVHQHAEAWVTGDMELLDSLLHDDIIFAYPGRRLNKLQTLEDLAYFRDHFNDTKIYINKIIIDGDNLGVEWQFATTKKETGERQVVSDAIIGKVKDDKFIIWKEYLDGRVKLLQATGELFLEESQEPYPWPQKTDQYGSN